MRSLPPLRTRLDSPSLAFLPAIVLAAGLLKLAAGGTLITTGFSGAIQTAPAGKQSRPDHGRSGPRQRHLRRRPDFRPRGFRRCPWTTIRPSIWPCPSAAFCSRPWMTWTSASAFRSWSFSTASLSGLDFIAASPTDPRRRSVGLREHLLRDRKQISISVDGILDFSVQTGVVGNQFATDVPRAPGDDCSGLRPGVVGRPAPPRSVRLKRRRRRRRSRLKTSERRHRLLAQ